MLTELSKRVISAAAALAVFASVPIAVSEINLKAAAESPTSNVEHEAQEGEENTDGHKFSEDYEKDETHHWQRCTTPDCPGFRISGNTTMEKRANSRTDN